MLKEGYIAANSIYLSYSHKNEDIQNYLHTVDKVFKTIKYHIENGSVLDALNTKVKSEGFKRLN